MSKFLDCGGDKVVDIGGLGEVGSQGLAGTEAGLGEVLPAVPDNQTGPRSQGCGGRDGGPRSGRAFPP